MEEVESGELGFESGKREGLGKVSESVGDVEKWTFRVVYGQLQFCIKKKKKVPYRLEKEYKSASSTTSLPDTSTKRTSIVGNQRLPHLLYYDKLSLLLLEPNF